MKILHVIPVVAPRYGGPSTVIFPLCNALHRGGNLDVEVATTNADGPGKEIDPTAIKTEYPVHVFPRIVTEKWQYSPSLGSWVKANTSRFDVIHIHALWTYPPGAAAKTARRHRVPYIVRPAGMLSPYTFARHSWRKQLSWCIRERRIVLGAAAFHATSLGEKQEILAIRPDAKVFVFPNGVADAAWTTPKSAPRALTQAGIPGDTAHRILFLSRLHPKKGIADLLLPAVARMRNRAVLVLAGGADDRAPGYENELRARTEQLGIADRVIFKGVVGGSECWQLYDSADVFVLPSHAENFGIVVAEAMARGCPVVVTDAVQASSHVTAAHAGLVVPREAGALADALDALLADKEARMEMSRAAQSYADENFRWDFIARRVAAMYDACAGSET